jgi:hypothetical protein
LKGPNAWRSDDASKVAPSEAISTGAESRLSRTPTGRNVGRSAAMPGAVDEAKSGATVGGSDGHQCGPAIAGVAEVLAPAEKACRERGPLPQIEARGLGRAFAGAGDRGDALGAASGAASSAPAICDGSRSPFR